MDDVIDVSAERFFSMAVCSDGSLWAWGRDCDEQLGAGAVEIHEQPVKIMENVASVFTSESHVMANCSDGSSVPLYFHIIDENKQEIVDIGLLPEWDEAETLSDIMDWNDTDSSIVSTYNGKSCCQFYQMYNRAETKTCIAFLLISNQ